MLTVWGRANSLNVQKVMWAVAELGLPHRRIEAGLAFGVNRTPEYLAMNPNGLVPTIDDDGFILWESNAIVRYLAAKYAAGTLWPHEPGARAHADRWMDWQTTAFSPAMGPAFFQLVRTPAEKRDARVVAESAAQSEAAAAVLDAHLAGRAYVNGDAFTMGDIPVGVAANRWLKLPLAREKRPDLEAWYRRLQARPGFAAHIDQPLS
jgi:glutathione S-transferase